MPRTLLIALLASLTGCLSVCPDARDKEAKARLFSMEEPSRIELSAAESLDASGLAGDARLRRRVLWMTGEETSARLGAFVAETDVSWTWRRDDREVKLSEKAVVELADSGDFRVAIHNDRDFGMELRWIAGVSYVKSRQGAFRERRADRAGHEAWREEALGQLQTLLELADGRVQIARTGAGSHEGRPVVKYTLAHAAAPDAAAQPPPRPSWAKDPVYPQDGPDAALLHRLAPFERGEPVRITGELWVDEGTATLVHADVRATFQVPPPEGASGPPARLDLTLRRELKRIGRDPVIDVPEHRPFERRPRAVKDPLEWWPPYVAEQEQAAAQADTDG
jgi:hypothetical protein